MERNKAQKRNAEKEARETAREVREAETVKCEAEELLKRDELEIMERIECGKHGIEVRILKRQKYNVRKSGRRKSDSVRKIVKRLKGMINYFAIWKRQN